MPMKSYTRSDVTHCVCRAKVVCCVKGVNSIADSYTLQKICDRILSMLQLSKEKKSMSFLRTLQQFRLLLEFSSSRPTFAAAIITIELSICWNSFICPVFCCCNVKNSCNWVTSGWILRLTDFWNDNSTNCNVNNNFYTHSPNILEI